MMVSSGFVVCYPAVATMSSRKSYR